MEILTFSMTVFVGFFAIMNPIAGVPVFLSMVEGADEKEKRLISKKATTVAFIIILCFILFGASIFKLFGITIPVFQITGSILIFYVGIEMLQSQKSKTQHLDKVAVDENIAISPLGIPLLAGPGTIVTAMNFVTHADIFHIGIVIAIFALMCYLTYLSFNLGEYLISRIGKNIITVLGKVMGLIIAIIGTNMVIEGIKTSFSIG
jgi:multiple antibiotic resistance protein